MSEADAGPTPSGFQILVHRRPGCGSEADVGAVQGALDHAMRKLDLPPNAEVAVVLADDAELARLNERFRDKHGPTDVLSFPVDPDDLPEGEAPVLGDVLISVAYARRSAEAMGREARDELCLLAVHGLLHLVGYEDETEEGADAMRSLELKLGVRRG